MSNAELVTESNFEEKVIKSELPVLLDFFAEWCGPCRMMGPVLDSVSTKLASKVNVCKIDTDQAPNIAAKYQISGIPCLILFKGGEEVKRLVGYQAEDALISAIEAAI
mgnify:CR=1 FL=1|jgi:thioredoxin 1